MRASAPMAKKIIGNIAPKKCDPTSPIIIFAGLVFHHKNPKQEPAIDDTKIDKSKDDLGKPPNISSGKCDKSQNELGKLPNSSFGKFDKSQNELGKPPNSSFGKIDKSQNELG